MKKFKTTGVCNPRKHYMVDISRKLDQLEKLVEDGKYFLINKPHQYGKTTMIFLLSKRLKEKNYFVIKLSFEGVGDLVFSNEKLFSHMFIKCIIDKLNFNNKFKEADMLKEGLNNVQDLYTMLKLVNRLVHKIKKKGVLIIDEVDKSSNSQLFFDFMEMLSYKYLFEGKKNDYIFHSVILVGVHDIKGVLKDYFDVKMYFNPKEIATMLKDYKEENGIKMNIEEVAKRIYYYTSGYPYLISKLSEIVDRKILPKKEDNKWLIEDVERAFKIILNINSVNFKSVIKIIDSDRKLYNLIRSILVDGESISCENKKKLIKKGKTYGIFKNKGTSVKIHNKIYEQLIYNYMISDIKTRQLINKDIGFYNFRDSFITPEGYLDFILILRKFQQFIKEQFFDQDELLLKKNAKLIFLAFLRSIIIREGFDFKEVQISQEKRLDVVVTYLDKKYVVELKIWRGEKYHQKGLEQLAEYLDCQNINKGYLVIFNFNESKEFKYKKIKMNNKEIFAIWV